MSSRELRDLSTAELESKELELKQELFNLRFQHAVKQLANTSRLKLVRREISRIKTILSER